jgi:urease accessory protein
MTPIALARLLQLSSQALPIGGYSHSQGLESAIEHGVVTDEVSVLGWVSDVLEFCMKTFEIPWMLSMGTAWAAGDHVAIASMNDEFISTRETAELRAAAVQMGFSLRALLYVLPDFPADLVDALRTIREPSLPCVWSAAMTAWQIEKREAVTGYLWTWAENQVLVAMKALPLGHSAGQRVLLKVGSSIAKIAGETNSCDIRTGDIGAGSTAGTSNGGNSNFSPALAILSSQHETQYSRLFRS